MKRAAWAGAWTLAMAMALGTSWAETPKTATEEAAAATVDCGPPESFAPEWRPVFQGVDYAEKSLADPPMAVYGVRVDLHAPGIAFIVTPDNGERPMETDGQKTSDFLEAQKVQVAVNASPYGPVEQIDGSPRNIAGLSISRGTLASKPASRYGAMLIDRDNHVWFAMPPIDTGKAYNAVGGFGLLLKDGKNVASDDERHPRTAAGTSKDGQYLYLIVIDGRQPTYSLGASTSETARWIQAFGAYDALNLDGGGSTTLVFDDGNGGARIMNRPIHLGLPGNERIVGNHLGVFAKPLEGK